ncbi:hypothetical protein QFC21_002951 [Naganishia friedmannii]|uniref:Uncharacterized protein n=1 Tax=Naganishia friedmannii TaxID=89922 RepID=A0ACC2VT20_9TREE|nr:hypothetical protein QFC21_002951 [Naganishia friedmannii]
MVKSKTPPPPTLPTAIKTSQEAKLEDGIMFKRSLDTLLQQWGTEHFYKTYYGHLPQFTCVSGYTGGETVNPTYRQVCSGATGHAESVKLTYQKGSIGYGELVEFHLRTHDPTTIDRQGPDRGSRACAINPNFRSIRQTLEYRSAIFYTTPEQKEIAEKVISEAQDKYVKGKIVTEVAPLKAWYNAEESHQDYLFENPNGYHCPSHYLYW